jgi:hypothetical protein
MIGLEPATAQSTGADVREVLASTPNTRWLGHVPEFARWLGDHADPTRDRLDAFLAEHRGARPTLLSRAATSEV